MHQLEFNSLTEIQWMLMEIISPSFLCFLWKKNVHRHWKEVSPEISNSGATFQMMISFHPNLQTHPPDSPHIFTPKNGPNPRPLADPSSRVALRSRRVSPSGSSRAWSWFAWARTPRRNLWGDDANDGPGGHRLRWGRPSQN